LKLKFICPICGNERLEEVCTGATLSHTVEVYRGGENAEYSETEIHEAYTDRFQCEECGYVLYHDNGSVVKTLEDASEWILDNVQQPIRGGD